MRQTLKKTLQPLEIALKKALGIRKERKGRIFDLRGFVQDSREKITRFVLFLPLFQKICTLTNISEFSNGTTTQTTTHTGGGNRKSFIILNPRSTR